MGEVIASGDFEGWLCKKLTSLDIDNDVYGSYITGILDEEDEEDTKKETLGEILEAVTEDSAELCDVVIQTYNAMKQAKNTERKGADDRPNIDEILAAHVGVTTTTMRKQTPKPEALTEEHTAIKKSVMAMYSSVPEDNEDDELYPCYVALYIIIYTYIPKNTGERDGKAHHHQTVDAALEVFENTNSKTVTESEKNARVKQKEESVKKKEQDKINLEKQKIKKAERKEKEKQRTQKKERGR
ncbi:coiled-coil domain-containing protein 43-like [Ciona intestinalis]